MAERFILLIVLVLFPLSMARAQYYHVTGRVTDPRGAGIWQVDLDIFDSQTGLPLNVANDLTDQNGNYDVLLFAGTFDIEYNAPPGVKLVSVVRRGIVVQGDVVVDVVFGDGYYLSGRVTDGLGTGVYHLDIDVDDPATGERILTPRDDTDINGDYLVVVPSGLFDLTYEPPVGSRLVAIAIRSVRIDGDTVIDVSLEDGYFVSGWVVDEGGDGLPDIDLDADDIQTGERIPTPRDNTDMAGHYVVVLPAGNFSIIFDPLTRNDIAPLMLDSVIVTMDTVLDTVALARGVRLSGHVADGLGGNVEGGDLDVLDSIEQRTILTLHDNTDSTGFYETVVPTGTYDLIMNPPPGSDLGEGFYSSVHIQNDTTVDFILGPAAIGEGTGDDGLQLPRGFDLMQNYPNPFNPMTSVRFVLPEAALGGEGDGGGTARVLLEIFDARGHRVRSLVDGGLPAGSYQIVWNGRDQSGRPVGSGIYIYRLTYGPYQSTRKMVVSR